jgi:type II restriction/modification system DNA methylase subunit YeeA
MTPFVWMFIKTYEKLREFIIENKSITTLVQMEYSAFEEATVPICSFVLKNGDEKEKGLFIKLSDFKGGMQVQKQKVLEALQNDSCDYFHETSKDNFSKIPGSPIAYWVNEKVIRVFENPKLGEVAFPREGLHTGDTNKYIRMWYEIDINYFSESERSEETIDTNNVKWIAYNKGGSYRKWYGNKDYVLAFDKKTRDEMKTLKGHVRPSQQFYFKKGITWTLISSSNFGVRCYGEGMLFDVSSHSLFCEEKMYLYYAGFMNTKLCYQFLQLLNPTMNFSSGVIAKLPVKIPDNNKFCESYVIENIQIAKDDWDSFETSWDFKKHPLIKDRLIVNANKNWEVECEDRFSQLKANEEELNRMFNEIYSLQDELSPEVEDKDITVRKADLTRDIKSFVSYAVGCIFGRYSLDKEGLIYAGGQWNSNKYESFIPDNDNCIPITDEEYFEDDIVGRFVEFVKVVYGNETLEENLDFIAKALGGKGDTSREVIRNYFIKDFFKDHVKTYQKRPIYWLYDSGKQNGFKALVYMHRYTADTTGIVRVDYLHKMQKIYMGEIDRMQDMIENSSHARDVAQAEKRKEKLIKQLKETKEYDEKIAHVALSRIDIDLDDGVKVNYEKVQTAQDGKKLDILAKI